MSPEQKVAIKGYVRDWAGYFMKLLQNKDTFMEQPDDLPDGFDKYGERLSRPNREKKDVCDLLFWLKKQGIFEEDFLKESDELRKAQIMDVWYKALFRFTEEEIYNSVNKGLNLVGEDVVYGEGFSEKDVLEKVENFCKARKASQQIQTTIEEIKKLIGACEELANEHKLTFNLSICDTDFDYKQTNSGGYWYSSSRNC